MTTKDVRKKFDIELNVSSDGSYDTFVNEEKDEFISFGIRQFYARRLSGLTSDRTSFEQWQKRSDDLRCVYTKKALLPVNTGVKNGNKYNEYDIPGDYWHMLSEDANVMKASKDNQGNTIYSIISICDVTECTTDNLTSRLNNTLGDHIYSKNKIRPLRLYEFNVPGSQWYDPTLMDVDALDPNNETFILGYSTTINDGSDFISVTLETPLPKMRSILYYKSPDDISIGAYEIEYIRRPNGFGLYSDEYKNGVFDENITIAQVPDYAWDEVLSIAIKHALENSSSYRIQTYNAERAEIQ